MLRFGKVEMETGSEHRGLTDHIVRALRCPFADECDYHGVFLYEVEFREHMEKFHPGEIFMQ
jgi:hypothetical protein